MLLASTGTSYLLLLSARPATTKESPPVRGSAGTGTSQSFLLLKPALAIGTYTLVLASCTVTHRSCCIYEISLLRF